MLGGGDALAHGQGCLAQGVPTFFIPQTGKLSHKLLVDEEFYLHIHYTHNEYANKMLPVRQNMHPSPGSQSRRKQLAANAEAGCCAVAQGIGVYPSPRAAGMATARHRPAYQRLGTTGLQAAHAGQSKQ